MNVCYITNFGEEHKMGLFHSVYNRIKMFKDHGHGVELFSIRKYHSPLLQRIRELFGAEIKRKEGEGFTFNGIRCTYVWYKETLFSYLLEKLSFPEPAYSTYADKFRKEHSLLQADLFVAHWGIESALFARQLSKAYQRPYVVVYHGSDINFPPSCWKRAMKQTMRHSAANIFVSQCLLRSAQKAFGDLPRPSVIHNGYDRQAFYPRSAEEKARIRERWGLDGKTVGFVGNLEKIKRADRLPELFGKIKSDYGGRISFIVIGQGTYRRLIEETSPDTICLGQRTSKEVAELMSVMDVLILPSRNEGYALVLAEALACGTPCVASKAGGIPEILPDELMADIDAEGGTELFTGKVCQILDGRSGTGNEKPFYSWDEVYEQEYRLFNHIHESFRHHPRP